VVHSATEACNCRSRQGCGEAALRVSWGSTGAPADWQCFGVDRAEGLSHTVNSLAILHQRGSRFFCIMPAMGRCGASSKGKRSISAWTCNEVFGFRDDMPALLQALDVLACRHG